MLILEANDKLQVVTSAAISLDVHASFMDCSQGTAGSVAPVMTVPDKQNTAIVTAATTDVVAAPSGSSGSFIRNVKTMLLRNKHASLSSDVTVVFNQNGTSFELVKVTLYAGETLEYIEGVGWYVLASNPAPLLNYSTTSQGAGFAADTYLTGSNISIPSGYPAVGSYYECTFAATKTAAGTATPIIQIRIGTAASTADTSRCSFTLSAGTAATDTGMFTVRGLFRTVGSGTNAVLQGALNLDSQPTTGFSSLLHAVVTTSGGFDSTVANSIIGVSVNGGASASWTVALVRAVMVL